MLQTYQSSLKRKKKSLTQQCAEADDPSYNTKVKKMSALYACVDNYSKQVSMVAEKSLLLVTENGQTILLHVLLSSSVSDLPETEDLFDLKRGSQTFSPCHIYFQKREHFPQSPNTMQQSLSLTKTILAIFGINSKNPETEGCNKDLSIDPILPG